VRRITVSEDQSTMAKIPNAGLEQQQQEVGRATAGEDVEESLIKVQS